MRILLTLFFVTALPAAAHAYVGPGLGAGTIALILGFILSVLLALFAVVWYPIKRLRKRSGRSRGKAAKR